MDSLLEYSIQKLSKLILNYAPNNIYANGEFVYKKSPVEADLTHYMLSIIHGTQYMYDDHLYLIEEMSGIHRNTQELVNCFSKVDSYPYPFYYDSPYTNSFEVAVLIDNERWERGLRDFSVAEFLINVYEKIEEEIVNAIDEEDDEEDDIGYIGMTSGGYTADLEEYMQKHDSFFKKPASHGQELASVSNAPVKSGVTAPKKR